MHIGATRRIRWDECSVAAMRVVATRYHYRNYLCPQGLEAMVLLYRFYCIFVYHVLIIPDLYLASWAAVRA